MGQETNDQTPETGAKEPELGDDWKDIIENPEADEIAINADQDAEISSDPITALEQERDQLKDQLLRALAETENMRRRTERETQAARKYGHTSFARDLVGAIDNLARAIEATETKAETKAEPQAGSESGSTGAEPIATDEATQSLIKGIELSWTEILSVIERHGIKQVNPVGEKFDYNLHQAMFELPTDEHEPGVVVEVVQHGYVLHDRLLRPAMVGVSKAPDKPTEGLDTQA